MQSNDECPPTPENLEACDKSPQRQIIDEIMRSFSPDPDDPLLRSTSPPPPCSICLDTITEHAYAMRCVHEFCYPCLLAWSKVITK